MVAHQAPLSLGFSRQEHWSGLPFPSPMHDSEKWKWRRSVVSDSQRPHGLQPTRLLHPWDFPGKSTGMGCHCLLAASKCDFYFWNVIISLSPWKNLLVISSENGGLLEGKNYKFNALNSLELFIISLLSLVIFMFAKVCLFLFMFLIDLKCYTININ